MKPNKKIIIIVVVLILLILVGVLIFKKTSTGNERILKTDYQKKIEQTDIVIKDTVTVTDFSVRYYAKEKKWFIEMVFENNTDKEVNLKEYKVSAYDKDNVLVKSIDAELLGNLTPKERRGLTIESKEDVSSVTHILVEKKK